MTTIELRYRDPSLPIEERVADLLARMTLDEKLAQLGSVWSFELFRTEDELDPERLRARLADGIGQVSRVAGATNLGPAAAADAGDAIQRFLIEETRLGIPAILHEETLHGLLARDAVSFQQAIGAAATFDPELVEAVAETIRRRMRSIGARLALAPVLDLCRDPRWGRIEETYGEDPYLATELGLAYIRGLQGPDGDLAETVAATAKHFVGHGLAEGGLNQAPAHAGWRELRDEQLAPFEAAVRGAHLAAIMPAYCDVDGLPCHASRQLLTTILRDEWGFDGLVVADYTAVQMLVGEHRLTSDLGSAAAMALHAGMDNDLPTTVAFGEPLRAAVEDGRVDPAALDEAVARTLRLKLRLGLFEAPFARRPTTVEATAFAADERRLAVDLATRSIVLLENDGILPLAPDARVAVIGPIADSARDLMGDYAHLLHIETLAELRHRANPFGFPPSDLINPKDELSGRATILSGLRDRLGADRVSHARGTGIRDGSDAELDEAVAAARSADVVIVVVGERSGLTEDATTGESRDRRELGLLGRQEELVHAVAATGTPLVLVVVSGRPLALEAVADRCAAILYAWVPGDAGPEAIASVIAGDREPGGRLPVTMPRHVGQVPLTYRHHPTGGRSNWKGDHVDGREGPLWPFGHGRSYTTFRLDGLRVDRETLATSGDLVSVSVDVTNVGERAGEEVVQLFARDCEASVARPVIELRGFRRVRLEPGECRTVTFVLSTEQLAFTGVEYRRVVEPGTIRLSVGRSSTDLPLSVEVVLDGPTVELAQPHHFVTGTTLG